MRFGAGPRVQWRVSRRAVAGVRPMNRLATAGERDGVGPMAEIGLSVRRRERLARKLRTLRSLPWPVIGWLAPVWLMIGLSAAAITVVPFRTLASLFGRGVDGSAPMPTLDGVQQRRVAMIGRTIAIAARYAPFRSDCYPRALVAALMCRLWRRPYALYFGLAAEHADGASTSGFSAHAWVTSGPVMLTGGAHSFTRYRVVSCFVPQYAQVA